MKALRSLRWAAALLFLVWASTNWSLAQWHHRVSASNTRTSLQAPNSATRLHESRLNVLLSSIPPAYWATREEVMLQLTHAILSKLNASIHGGFVRDWLLRGERANDIDVWVDASGESKESIERSLHDILERSVSARRRGVKITGRRVQEFALTLTVEAPGMASFDIDLVDPRTFPRVMPPGVDSDAGNVMFSRDRQFYRKVDNERVRESLEVAIDHVRKKAFVFYYAFEHGDARLNEIVLERLTKHLRRGWTCLSQVPFEVVRTLPRDLQKHIRPTHT